MVLGRDGFASTDGLATDLLIASVCPTSDVVSLLRAVSEVVESEEALLCWAFELLNAFALEAGEAALGASISMNSGGRIVSFDMHWPMVDVTVWRISCLCWLASNNAVDAG